MDFPTQMDLFVRERSRRYTTEVGTLTPNQFITQFRAAHDASFVLWTSVVPHSCSWNFGPYSAYLRTGRRYDNVDSSYHLEIHVDNYSECVILMEGQFYRSLEEETTDYPSSLRFFDSLYIGKPPSRSEIIKMLLHQ